MSERLLRLFVQLALAQAPAQAWRQMAAQIKTALERTFDWIAWRANPLLAIIGVAAVVVAVLTLRKIERQTKATEVAAIAASEAVKVAQATLAATFRPKLIVRSLTMYCEDNTKPFKVGYDLVNIGGALAQVTHSEACVHYKKGRLGDVGGNASTTAESRDIVNIGPGVCAEQFLELGNEVAQRLNYLATRSAQGVNNPELVGQIYFTGRVEYRDSSGNVMRTAFHRKYNQDSKRFSAVNDPDYEYLD